MNDRLRTLPWSPAEGWISVVLVLVMSATLAWSMDDAAWVLGRERWTDFLALTVVWGVAVGFIGAKVGWGRWLTYAFGALFAALVLPLYVGNVLVPEGTWLDQYEATAASVVNAYRDLGVLGRTVTQESGHFLLVLGMVTWATGLFASYTVFGHRRPLNAIIVVGLLLVANMSFTYRDQLTFLVIFSLAALFLLIRSHALDEQGEWIRRRIGDPSAVSAIYLRGGSAFIAIAVVGSIVLTQAASSAPLAGALRGVGDQVIELGRDFQRFLPTGGANRTFGIDFGSSVQISTQWQFQDQQAVTIEFLEDDPPDHLYWRAAVYDEFEFSSWRQRERIPVDRAANVDLVAGTAEAIDAEARQAVPFRIFPDGYRRPSLLSPETPVTVDHAVRMSVVGAEGFFAGVEGNGDAPYAITALVPLIGDEHPRGLTANRLRAAGTDYPAEIRDRYLRVPDDVVPANGDAAAVLAEVLDRAEDPDNPYDVARTMEAYLKSSAFRYHVDLRNQQCEGLSTVECFARERVGFCQQYATTMAILMREAGIPARYVSGFLPGERLGGVERVQMSSAHAWVEVYFPGYGWVTFDPTGGGLSQAAPLPTGEPVESAAPGSSSEPGASGPLTTRRPFDEPTFGPGGVGGPAPTTGGSTGVLIGVALVLLLVVGGLAFIAWQRGTGGDLTPDRAYGALTRMAGRMGFGPRPTQTVYEYAGALSEVLPQSRPEIQMVAQAKVEVAYGRRALGADRMAALREAQRRLRVGLLRLLFRRGERPRRR